MNFMAFTRKVSRPTISLFTWGLMFYWDFIIDKPDIICMIGLANKEDPSDDGTSVATAIWFGTNCHHYYVVVYYSKLGTIKKLPIHIYRDLYIADPARRFDWDCALSAYRKFLVDEGMSLMVLNVFFP